MTRALRELERVETRVLGATRFVDVATGNNVEAPLRLRALDGDAGFVRNPAGLVVLSTWSGLAEHAAAFTEPPALPAAGSLEMRVEVTDPSGLYLPRLVSLALPRDPAPGNAASEDSLFRPVEVPMYPTARSATGANWAVLRVQVAHTASGDALGGALVRVRRNGNVIARGLTDGRGEALVPVVGVPMLTFGDDDEAVVVTEVTVTIHVLFDPETGSRTPQASLGAGGAVPTPVVDPSAIEASADPLPEAQQQVSIAARRSQTLAMTLDLP